MKYSGASLAELFPDLSHPASLSHVRSENSIFPLPANKAQLLILRTSLQIYRHERVITFWSNRCRDSKNTLAWFINRVQGKGAGSVPLTFLNGDFNIETVNHFTQKDSRNRRILSAPTFPISSPTNVLPLEAFDDLYYAIIAKVRELHADLKVRLENQFLDPDKILHCCGVDFRSRQSFRAIEMLNLLNKSWELLTDPPLMKALDLAVRARILFSHESVMARSSENPILSPARMPQRPHTTNGGTSLPYENVLRSSPKSDGLVDFTALPPAAIVADLCEKRYFLMKQREEQALAIQQHGRVRHMRHRKQDSDSIWLSVRQLFAEEDVLDDISQELACPCDHTYVPRSKCAFKGQGNCICSTDKFRGLLQSSSNHNEPVRNLFDDDDGTAFDDGDPFEPNAIDLMDMEDTSHAQLSPMFGEVSRSVRETMQQMEEDYIDRRMYHSGMRLECSCSQVKSPHGMDSLLDSLTMTQTPARYTFDSDGESLVPKPLLTPTKDSFSSPASTWSSPDSNLDSLARQSNSSTYRGNHSDVIPLVPLPPVNSDIDLISENWSASLSLSPCSPPPVISSRFVSAGPGSSRIEDRPESNYPFAPPFNRAPSGITLERLKQVDPERLREQLQDSCRTKSEASLLSPIRDSSFSKYAESSTTRKRKRAVLKEGLHSVRKAIRRMTD